MKNTTTLKLALSTSLILTAGCSLKLQSQTEQIKQTELASTAVGTLKVNVNAYTSNRLVCDPFSIPVDDPAPNNYEKGLKANLFYRDGDMPRMYKTTDYINFAKKSDKIIFLTDVNVPTRMFTEGFSTPSGDTLKKDTGEKLIEFFGLKMSTNIILANDDTEGEYELALLSDDGANMIIKSGTGSEADEILIANDGDHPTKMGCSSRVVRFRKNVMLPVELTYYQGPKYHISNMLIWRKSSTAGTDSACNTLGNNLFFNPNQNSAPQQAFKDLESRGWKVLKPDNFVVSSTKVDYNPCVKGTDPVISGFGIGEVSIGLISLTWSTDIPATSQIQITNMTTGEVTTTNSDNQLRTVHDVTLENLQPRTVYKVRAISVSSDLGRSQSVDLTLTTQ
jgi:hypothetical protein